MQKEINEKYGIDETSKIFTTVSKVLKDNLLLEMKKNNDFMRNYIVKNSNDMLYKYKVLIKEHVIGMSGGVVFPETEGIILNLDKYNVIIMFRNSDSEIKIRCFHINNIVIIDERAENIL